MDLGFTISPETQKMIIVVFFLYTLIIVVLGAYVKYASRNEDSTQKVAGFLTGGGNLGALSVGLIMVTNIMSSGGMVGGPGMSYGTGFIWSLCVFCSFINIFLSLGSVGKKMAIMGRRTGAQTVLQLFRHRYQSKLFSSFLGLTFIVFLLPYAGSQFIGGGKLFSVVTGSGNYRIGVLLFAGITLIYTLTGGIKSISKIAVVQGAIMIISVISIYVATGGALFDKFGSLQSAMEFVQQSNPALLDARTWAPLYFIGTACIQSFALIPLPHALMGTFTYNSSKTLKNAIVVGIVSYTIIQFTMSGIGPLAYAVNPNVSQGDYVIPMLLSTLLPPAMGGVVIAGAVAAIQSTVASFFIIIASTIVKDLYKTLFKPDMSEETENKGNMIFTIIAAAIAIIMAMFPSEYLQVIVNFAIGGLAAGFFFPLFFGLYWKKATPVAAIAGTMCGTAVYILATVLSSPVHPILLAFAVSGIVMVVLSHCTPKVKLGVFEVWFGEQYDESYARID
ncbi:sodium/pantothenate symporter [Faecalicatena orotica]|uniref:Sodium/pantothenate symporter n=1 Tax=Faecalicatena orotica TaxID=1544 RepID=A0A2Y9BP19_9FIRM|nr:hypothetical protein [Faecalicatena orotica]PWJ22844.1 sodium/pantothenate symporter [Faecalicatena orotica]SSA57979.1 sodium/pantothenate symporter [Faecalicatena orotica]